MDSERIITSLRAEGYEIARKHDGADLVIVNTCGFLDSARGESLQAIGTAMYEQQAAQEGGASAESAEDDGVVDAEVVDDDESGDSSKDAK